MSSSCVTNLYVTHYVCPNQGIIGVTRNMFFFYRNSDLILPCIMDPDPEKLKDNICICMTIGLQ